MPEPTAAAHIDQVASPDKLNSPPEVVLGFDFGTKRIGVAVGNGLTGTAQALTTLHHENAPDWQALTQLIKEWQPQALVVGMPVTQDGSDQKMTGLTRAFIQKLETQFSLPVYASDERFSSIEAEVRLRQQRASGARKRRVQASDTDAVAAQIILESWLAEQPL